MLGGGGQGGGERGPRQGNLIKRSKRTQKGPLPIPNEKNRKSRIGPGGMSQEENPDRRASQKGIGRVSRAKTAKKKAPLPD